MELEEIRKIFKLLKNTDISEFSYEKDGEKIKIKRGKVASRFDLPEEEVQRHPDALKKIHEEAVAEGEAHGLFTVTSPIVGTFYRSPSPDAPPFVDMGSEVKKGQVLCIIEAMKLMNEIESEIDGTMVRVLVENGQPVEYGEPLFLINPL
ncbi:MAG: acetyl-CoA carboxylase biotin carboxyl carrier protein [bacterium]